MERKRIVVNENFKHVDGMYFGTNCKHELVEGMYFGTHCKHELVEGMYFGTQCKHEPVKEYVYWDTL